LKDEQLKGAEGPTQARFRTRLHTLIENHFVRGSRKMQLTSSDFQPGGSIPIRFTCEGDDISPKLSWQDAPTETKSFVLTLRDPDAPKAGGFTHWLLYNIPPNLRHIEHNVPKQPTVPGIGLQGKNDGGEIGYMGPCPPSGTHRYFVRLFALDTEP
jgi:Raf kinase inhibitor-like YbhB/YbcL family protein